MSNFKGWTSDNYAEMQHEQLKGRLEKSEIRRRETPSGTEITMVKVRPGKSPNAKPAKPYNSPIIDELLAMVTPELLAKTEKRMMKELKKKSERDPIGTTFIGVDPALRKGGFWMCIICRVDNTATFVACKHLGEYVRILQDANPIAVIVENSNLQKNIFARNTHSGIGGAISVGKNMGVSQAATDIAQEYSVIPSGISPQNKGAKVTNEAIFQGIVQANTLTLTKYKPGNGIGQDQRDALALALRAEQAYKLHLKVKI
jgi:hypothetical protein